MPTGDFLEYDAKGIAQLLAQEALEVPMYQRSYSWRSHGAADGDEDDGSGAQVFEYWEDLQQGFRSSRPYFLGTVVLSGEGATAGRKAVIDGQQRLATTCILMAAIRDAYRERAEEQYATSVHGDFVAKFDRNVGQDQPRLILNSDDREFFEKAIVKGQAGVSPTGESQRLLASAWEVLQSRVREFCDSAGVSWKPDLDRFSEYVNKEAQVIAITVATAADAFLIFETLNDRGADLTVADLLKNFLFSRAAGRLDEVRDSWVLTLNNLDTPKVGNRRFNLFARHYMSSKRGPVRERELYARIKEEVNDPAGAVGMAKALQANARLYNALISIESEVWSDFSESTRQAAEVLVELNLERYRPLLLAALDTFTPSEIERLIPTMVSWSVRGLAAGVFGGGVAEAAFCRAAVDIRAGKVTTTESVLGHEAIDRLIPNDRQFEIAFSEWRITKGSLARYVLRALELERRDVAEPELVVNPDVEKVNLEHILPKSPKATDWPQFTDDDIRAYTYRLGNLALLQKGANGRIGNKPWSTKRPILKNSQLVLTQEAAVPLDWTTDAISDRQAQLAKLAVRAWPRKPR
ncbi:MAG TPA: DUF262 domain-containing HNH endonuclease family protein [Acidimicrobiales bacterium]|nr:DUF262 domain-containing HNH endonuclease family protein [Acidimicrobiales bacterium]